MKNDNAVELRNVEMHFNMSKEKLYSLKEYFIKFAKRELRFERFIALKDISFDIKKGDVFGILGLNGSGKSTTLKLISGILSPTKGTIKTQGTIAPLIELGAGFAFVGSEKKIKVGDNYKYIDLLFFNYEENCFVVIELKVNKLSIRDIGQLEFYVNYIDAEIKKGYHNPTIGILICKKNDEEALRYFSNSNIKVTTYKNIA